MRSMVEGASVDAENGPLHRYAGEDGYPSGLLLS